MSSSPGTIFNYHIAQLHNCKCLFFHHLSYVWFADCSQQSHSSDVLEAVSTLHPSHHPRRPDSGWSVVTVGKTWQCHLTLLCAGNIGGNNEVVGACGLLNLLLLRGAPSISPPSPYTFYFYVSGRFKTMCWIYKSYCLKLFICIYLPREKPYQNLIF